MTDFSDRYPLNDPGGVIALDPEDLAAASMTGSTGSRKLPEACGRFTHEQDHLSRLLVEKERRQIDDVKAALAVVLGGKSRLGSSEALLPV